MKSQGSAVLPVLFWIILLFSVAAGLPRSFVQEEESQTAIALRLAATPAGRNAGGLPMGLQLTGRWQGDEDLLRFGQEIARVAEGERRG